MNQERVNRVKSKMQSTNRMIGHIPNWIERIEQQEKSVAVCWLFSDYREGIRGAIIRELQRGETMESVILSESFDGCIDASRIAS
jgi:hypothetical protein